jgi:transcriptional regulator with XRE-family HTH domain
MNGGSLVNQLRRAMDASGLTNAQLCKLTKNRVSEATISRIRNGKSGGRLSTIEILADALGLKLTGAVEVGAENVAGDGPDGNGTTGGASAEGEGKLAVACFPNREAAKVQEALERAESSVLILAAQLTVSHAHYYLGAIAHAEARGGLTEVKILAARPDSEQLSKRAEQIGGTFTDRSRADIHDALEEIGRAFKKRGRHYELRTYDEFPLQQWYAVDREVLYLANHSIGRLTSDNVFFRVPVALTGVRETFLDHFDSLWRRNEPREAAPAAGNGDSGE